MMLVEPDVAEALRIGDESKAALFVAGCAERMAQVFTGFRARDPARGRDLETYIGVLQSLWDPVAPAEVFGEGAGELKEFPESQPTDLEFTSVVDIYSFYAVLVMRYAVRYRSAVDVEEALRCGHAVLTAMGQLDQNIPQGGFFDDESDWQRRIALGPGAGPAELRAGCWQASRERLIAIQRRIG
jgi:hypothetical protein